MSNAAVRKLALASLIIAAAVILRIAIPDDLLSLASIKASQHRLTALYAEHRLAVIVLYMTMYVSFTLLSLPVAAVMTLAGGALFGPWTGTVIISFASSIGAALSFIVSRYMFRDWVQEKFGDRLLVIDKGISEYGAFYLFTLRLIPIFPFFMINLLMGLTKMPLRTFYWVSQVGMLPATLIFANAGKELGKVQSVEGIFSPGLIISFVLLGLFPLVVKKLLSLYKARKGIPVT